MFHEWDKRNYKYKSTRLKSLKSLNLNSADSGPFKAKYVPGISHWERYGDEEMLQLVHGTFTPLDRVLLPWTHPACFSKPKKFISTFKCNAASVECDDESKKDMPIWHAEFSKDYDLCQNEINIKMITQDLCNRDQMMAYQNSARSL